MDKQDKTPPAVMTRKIADMVDVLWTDGGGKNHVEQVALRVNPKKLAEVLVEIAQKRVRD